MFDTYAAAKALRDAGFDELQAEAAVSMVRDAISEGAATGEDVSRLEGKVESEAARLESKVNANAAEAKADAARIEGKVESEAARIEGKVEAEAARIESRIDTGLAETKADIYRALWMQTGAIIAVMTALIAAFKLFG